MSTTNTMNGRIKELVYQTGYILDSDNKNTGMPVDEEFVKKFAELILQECITVAEEVAFKHQVKEDTYSAGKKAGAFEVASVIKEKLGKS